MGSRIVILEAIHRFFDNTRTKELFLRWAEMAMFTPFMRTHEETDRIPIFSITMMRIHGAAGETR